MKMYTRMRQLFATFTLSLMMVELTLAQDIVIFDDDDATGKDYYDASWGNATTSFLYLIGPGKDKMPINNAQKYQGLHSGIIRWQQKAGGEWRLFIAADNWAAHNATGFDSLIFYLNGPQAVSGDVLPHLGLEDTDNQLSNTTPLSVHFPGLDADLTTWQRAHVPLTAFQPFGNFDLDKLKTVRFSNGAAATDTLTLWVDEIRLIKKARDTQPPAAPQNLRATPYDRLVELDWDDNTEADLYDYQVYRATNATGPFTRLSSDAVRASYHFDTPVANGTVYYYKVTAVDSSTNESGFSNTVAVTPMSGPATDLLELEQRAAFYFFWYGSNPNTGVSLDRMTNPTLGATGSTGFALTTYPIAAERGWITRAQAAERTLKVLRFYRDRADRFHGFFPHFLHTETGRVIELFNRDNGADVVESAYFFAGALTCRQYFTGTNAVETEIRQIATELYHAADWQFLRRNNNGDTLQTISWHWSPNYGSLGMRVNGFNEAMIVYLLALGSPTHAVPASTYHQGWASTYRRNRFYFGMILPVESLSSSLFTYQYTHCWVDFRNKRDAYADYFENSRIATLINRQYCISQAGTFGYSDSLWGLTACDGPGFPPFQGYAARGPFQSDDGTIAPTAALASMPFTPQESLAALVYMYHHHRDGLWGPYGFKDAFNLKADPDWFDPDYIGIDQGPIVIMIENYRSQLIWNLFMSNPEIQEAMKKAGYVTTAVEEKTGDALPRRFVLEQNFPNPFNAGTSLRYYLPQAGVVHLAIYDLNGKLVNVIVDGSQAAGEHVVNWDGRNQHGATVASGIYWAQLTQEGRIAVRKLVVMR
ncbi:MAG: T9SS type A sorting domain-containing protein [candidate division KSB1 bacterium]|nr:T9SS type A sorting domain-containing protein [candidate division KSB1 bacterium]MDZ7300992.1 T9SS type A sorting domain-containing protein [candidate division KSB1 bacterium]MDZ7310329.1 T9SS type A sorting domain-containing protein [candidate division KSB1 bacterium]